METNSKLPILGQTYFYFDDGKISKSRRDEVTITEVIPFSDIDEDTLKFWKEEVEACSGFGLYESETDFFIKGFLKESNEEAIFVRSKGGWFSIGPYLSSGRLDIDGSLNARLDI